MGVRIKNINKIDLGTIDLSIQLGNKCLEKLPKLNISEDAKAAWVHEITASNARHGRVETGLPRWSD